MVHSFKNVLGRWRLVLILGCIDAKHDINMTKVHCTFNRIVTGVYTVFVWFHWLKTTGYHEAYRRQPIRHILDPEYLCYALCLYPREDPEELSEKYIRFIQMSSNTCLICCVLLHLWSVSCHGYAVYRVFYTAYMKVVCTKRLLRTLSCKYLTYLVLQITDVIDFLNEKLFSSLRWLNKYIFLPFCWKKRDIFLDCFVPCL